MQRRKNRGGAGRITSRPGSTPRNKDKQGQRARRVNNAFLGEILKAFLGEIVSPRHALLTRRARCGPCKVASWRSESRSCHNSEYYYYYPYRSWYRTLTPVRYLVGVTGPVLVLDLTLAELHVRVLTSFIKFNKALTKIIKALPKPYHGLVEILL